MNNPVQIGNWLLDLSSQWVFTTVIILILALPFIVLSAWRRLHQRKPTRAMAVVALNLFAAIILLLLLTEPVREHLSTRNIVVISEGARHSDLPAQTSDDVYVLRNALIDETDKRELRNANWLADAGQLVVREPALAKMDLYGFGLNEAQWAIIPENVEIQYSPPSVQGFHSMQWSRSLAMGSNLQITGRFDSTDDKRVIDIRLLDPGDKLIAETRVLSGGYFDLQARPKSPGNVKYRLQAWRGNEQLADETVAVFVAESPPQRILVQQSAPSYETRQLKNYVTELGATLVLNSRISRGKSISQSVNLPEGTESTFSPANLTISDWLIIDGRALVQLQPHETQWLSDAANGGLGVLVLADDSLLNEFELVSAGLLNGFALSANPNANTEVVPQLVNMPAFENELSLPVPAMTLASSAAANDSLNPIISSSSGRLLLASRQRGLGHIAVSLINQSHQWFTAGQRIAWSNYWLAISSAISRQRQDTFLLVPPSGTFSRINQRVQICAFGQSTGLSVRISSGSKPLDGELTAHSINLPLTPDLLGSARKCGWYWPQNHGWHQIDLLAENSDNFVDRQSVYIYATDQWVGQRQFESVMATMDRQAKIRTEKNQEALQKLVSEPLNPFWLWLMFVVVASLLWLERKLDWDA